MMDSGKGETVADSTISRKAIIWSLLIILIVAGCIYRKVDYLSHYRFTGRVFDGGTEVPINGASVFFIDRGLDEYMKTIDKPIKVCESNSEGEIEATFEYFWGTTKGAFRKKPTGDFIVQIIKDGYAPKTLLRNVYELEKEDRDSKVELGNIYLDKKSTFSKNASQSKPTTANQPRMSEETVIKIAKEAAERVGYKLEDYKEPVVHFELDKTGEWVVIFHSKINRLVHFFVTVDDETGRTRIMPGE